MNGSIERLRSHITSGAADHGFTRLYHSETIIAQKQRYLQMLDWAEDHRLSARPYFVSAPGRTELGGNHTDHNNGRVLAASVDLDCVALVAPTNNLEVELVSEELGKSISLKFDLLEPQAHEAGTSAALVRGVASALHHQSCRLSGFKGIVSSTCKVGSGLSSSAAFSVLIGGVITQLCPDAAINPETIAQCACHAENVFFGKPCGLMDQMSSALGGVIAMDLKNPDRPVIRKIALNFDDTDFQLVIIDTGSSHAELTDEYAAVPREIERAVSVYGRQKARGLSMKDLFERIPEIRSCAGDRALLRLMHFISEDERAALQADALDGGRFEEFIELVKRSGASSCNLLQNCGVDSEFYNQGVRLALALTSEICPDSVSRVHGGGFGGTIQAYIPREQFRDYESFMESVFGSGSVIPIRTGRPGICCLTERGWLFPTDDR